VGAVARLSLARHPGGRHLLLMLNIVSLLIGLVTLALGLVAFMPLLGWLNWFIIPIGIVGAAVGALSSSSSGRNLNLVLIVIFALRLMLGGGII
jgi:hypothetical protein